MKFWYIVLFFVGICVQLQLPFVMPLWIGWLLLPGVPIWIFLAWRFNPHSRLTYIFGAGLFLIAGLFWAALRADIALSHRFTHADQSELFHITGTVVGLPIQTDTRISFDIEPNTISPTPHNSKPPRRIRLSWYAPKNTKNTRNTHNIQHTQNIQNIQNAQNVQNAQHTPLPTIKPAQQWSFTARLKPTRRPYNPHTFDANAYYLATSIDAFGTVLTPKKPDSPIIAPKILHDRVFHFQALIDRFRQNIQTRIQSDPASNPWSALIVALSIGNQRDIDQDTREVFRRTGATHLISISGLHLSVLALFIGGFFRWLWRHIPRAPLRIPAQKIGVLAAAIAAILYAFIAGSGIPIQRAAVMVVVTCIMLWRNSTLSGFALLAQALFFVVFLDPWAPLFAGFWLSFWGVAIILTAVRQNDHTHPRWKKSLDFIRIQFIITLAMVPLTWWFFQQVSMISVAANLIAIPFVSIIITPLALLAALFPISALLSACSFCLTILSEILTWFAQWPIASLSLPKPPLILVIATAAGLFGCLYIRRPIRWVCLIFCLPLLFWQPEKLPAGQADIIVFDVGQGNATLIRTANHAVLIDTGPRFDPYPSPASRFIVPYLRSMAIERLNTVIISHEDNDHSGGVVDILSEIPVTDIRTPLVLTKLGDIVVPQRLCRQGQSWVWDGVRFDVLYPDEYAITHTKRKNDKSCMIRVSTTGASILFPGDLGYRPLNWLSKSVFANQLDSDILIAPHHGSKSSSPERFIERVSPAHVIFSAAHHYRFRHPHPDVVKRYEKTDSTFWHTANDGAILIHLLPNTYHIQSMTQYKKRYWH